MSPSLTDRITTAFVRVAAFCAATAVFFSITLLFRVFPPAEPVAIGLVTIERVSKAKDYAGAVLFLLLVPVLTVWFEGVLARASARLGSFSERALFTLPWLLAPFLYLTTGKVGWILLLPLVLSLLLPRALSFSRTHRWLRELFDPREGAWHAALFSSESGWLLFRYLVTGKRIAHFPTLILEVVFVLLFLSIAWAAAIVIARTSATAFGTPFIEAFRRVAFASLPLATLPFVALALVPLEQPRLIVASVAAVCVLVGLLLPRPDAGSVRAFVAWLLLPSLLYAFSYASTAHLSQWIDLFHRGEAIGPASDYLRGKVPYLQTFPLHGMLEDGLLDAWLMEWFGRSMDVAIARTVVLGALLAPAIWYLGLAVFESMPLALLCVAMGSWTTAENNRTFLQVAAVALLWAGLRRRSRLVVFAAGVFGGVALFFSYDIGLYTIAGGLLAPLLLALATRRTGWDGLAPGRAAMWFVGGVVAGTVPFVAYLSVRGALLAFASTSFVVIPRIVDPVWSLPFPDLVTTFRRDLSLHSLADFVLSEKLHLILSPLAIAVASVYYLVRWKTRRADLLDHALLVVGVFALVAQRTAFGRAEFQHQYFAAFLVGPMLVLLGRAAVRSIAELWRGGSQEARAFVAAIAVAAVPVIAIVLWIPDLVDARLKDLTRYSARVRRVERDPQAEEVALRIDDVAASVRALTPRGEPIFDFSNQPAFYFFADRPNPTRFYQVPILSPRELQAEAIGAIDRARTRVVLRRSPERYDQFDGVRNELRAQALAAYIDEVYEFHHSVRGVEIWTRRPGAKARPASAYLRAIRLPDPTEIGSEGDARMLFPAAGGVPGPYGSLWRSGLTLHNPFGTPLSMTLRFVTAGASSDRHMTIAPHETIRWDDVVTSLFGLGGRAGTLWIEHRESRPPVAVVRTADVGRGSHASLEQPLTDRDAAEAQTRTPELVIVGLPKSVPGQRVNLGVVNVGRIPATFRVSIQSRAGKELGTTAESGAPEDSVWTLDDVERLLGASLDETTTLRIRVVAGRGVAWATVIAPNGDAELIAASPAEAR